MNPENMNPSERVENNNVVENPVMTQANVGGNPNPSPAPAPTSAVVTPTLGPVVVEPNPQGQVQVPVVSPTPAVVQPPTIVQSVEPKMEELSPAPASAPAPAPVNVAPRDNLGIPNNNQIDSNKETQIPARDAADSGAKKVEVEYKPPSKFKIFCLIVFLAAMLAFVIFLPDIKDYVEDFQNKNNNTPQDLKITTGKLKCSEKSNTEALDKDYDLVFHFTDNQLEKTEFSITTKGDATTDEEILDQLASTCKQLEKESESIDGLYVKCTLTTGKLEEIQSFDLSVLDPDKLDAAFSEAGGNNPEYQYKQDMDKIEQNMNASGYTCARER